MTDNQDKHNGLKESLGQSRAAVSTEITSLAEPMRRSTEASERAGATAEQVQLSLEHISARLEALETLVSGKSRLLAVYSLDDL